MIDHTLFIRRRGNSLSVKVIDGSGSEVDAKKYHIDPNADTTVNLCWHCDDGEFAVLFHFDRNPFASDNKVHAAHSGGSTRNLKIRGLKTAEQDADIGDREFGATFKYGVAVLHPGTGEVLRMDPDIIIDDQGGGN